MSNNTPVPNHSLEYYEPVVIEGKNVLATLDRRTSFPFGTDEEKENTLNYFKEGKNNE